jgi:hypothetical protein
VIIGVIKYQRINTIKHKKHFASIAHKDMPAESDLIAKSDNV